MRRAAVEALGGMANASGHLVRQTQTKQLLQVGVSRSVLLGSNRRIMSHDGVVFIRVLSHGTNAKGIWHQIQGSHAKAASIAMLLCSRPYRSTPALLVGGRLGRHN